jgi:adenylate cyclase
MIFGKDKYLSPATLDQSITLARTAIELDPNLPEAYAELGYNIIRKHDFDAATIAAERAIALNPNFADYRLAQVFYSVGQPTKAIEIAKTQMRLDPFHPHFAPLIAGIAYYLLKEYSEAQLWLREATGRAPNHHMATLFFGRDLCSAWASRRCARRSRGGLAGQSEIHDPDAEAGIDFETCRRQRSPC